MGESLLEVGRQVLKGIKDFGITGNAGGLVCHLTRNPNLEMLVGLLIGVPATSEGLETQQRLAFYRPFRTQVAQV